VDASAAPGDYDNSAVVYEEVATEEESHSLVLELSTRLRRYGALRDSRDVTVPVGRSFKDLRRDRTFDAFLVIAHAAISLN
jgi:hypothetical protein